jgi:hypothetical protein
LWLAQVELQESDLRLAFRYAKSRRQFPKIWIDFA